MGKTRIEWCDETDNFITGCRGDCSYCYARGAAGQNVRRRVPRYVVVKETTGDAFTPAFHQNVMGESHDRLARARRPRVVFLGSMSDPFSEGPWKFYDGTENSAGRQECTDQWVQEMLAYFCRRLPLHRFILLTKKVSNVKVRKWPDNVWIGTSVADHSAARYRIPMLLTNLQMDVGNRNPKTGVVEDRSLECGGTLISVEPLQGGPDPADFVDPAWFDGAMRKPGWLIIGSQTRPALAPDKVPHVVDNARQLVAWAAENGVPCFIKDNLVQLSPDDRWPREFPEALRKENL